MSQVTVYQCDWCEHRGERNGGALAKIRLPKAVVPESLQHVDSGTERVFDTCPDCVEKLADLFDGFAEYRKIERENAAAG